MTDFIECRFRQPSGTRYQQQGLCQLRHDCSWCRTKWVANVDCLFECINLFYLGRCTIWVRFRCVDRI